jgi:hypothetical protein
MIDDLYLICIVVIYACVGALGRVLFGLFKALRETANTGEFTFNWRRVLVEFVTSVLLGGMGVVIISDSGGMGLNTTVKILAMVGGLFGPDILGFIAKKFGITTAFDIRFTDEQVMWADLNTRQINAMRYLKVCNRMTSLIYQKINQASPRTAVYDLTQLVKKGKLEKFGEGKSTYYKTV